MFRHHLQPEHSTLRVNTRGSAQCSSGQLITPYPIIVGVFMPLLLFFQMAGKMEIPTNCSFCKQDNLTNINPEYIRGVKVRLCEANVDDKLKFLRKLITIIGNL
ncbi:PREDICTED: uncharacterized protein LOC108970940 isoform X1 [Bactrocera latifrons]|uniref:uncharacterized protein LOC108970940 isoform X1 n=1 Tax=Bactrocera latifrons TaxID=174628 RepID=UPI0008DD88A5|nr:PREDICTED: uncharacterized protein LOC108970940 isoform X1 [Bactrocera latifrons]